MLFIASLPTNTRLFELGRYSQQQELPVCKSQKPHCANHKAALRKSQPHCANHKPHRAKFYTVLHLLGRCVCAPICPSQPVLHAAAHPAPCAGAVPAGSLRALLWGMALLPPRLPAQIQVRLHTWKHGWGQRRHCCTSRDMPVGVK